MATERFMRFWKLYMVLSAIVFVGGFVGLGSDKADIWGGVIALGGIMMFVGLIAFLLGDAAG